MTYRELGWLAIYLASSKSRDTMSGSGTTTCIDECTNPRSSLYERSGGLLSSEGPKWRYVHNNVVKIVINPMASRAYCEPCQLTESHMISIL